MTFGGHAAGVEAHSFLACGNEIKEVSGAPALDIHGACLGDRLTQINPAEKEHFVEPFDLPPLEGVEAGTSKTDDVQAADSVYPVGDRKWGQVFVDGRVALHQGQRAHPHELVHPTVGGQKGAVLDHNMTGQLGAGDNDTIVNHGIMADMTPRHQEIVRSDLGWFLDTVGPVDGDMFSEHILIPDDQARGFLPILQILRRIADHATGVEPVFLSNFGVTGEVNMGAQRAVFTQFDVCVDDGIRPDSRCGRNDGVRVNDSGWMYQRCNLPSKRMVSAGNSSRDFGRDLVHFEKYPNSRNET